MKQAVNLNAIDRLCTVKFMRNVQNGSDIKEKLIKGEIDATIVNASLIPDVLQLYVAANKSALSESKGSKLTKTIHTEVLYNLSPTKKVRESLKVFGIDDNVKDLLILVFDDESGAKMSSVLKLVHGDLTDMSELEEAVDWSKIAKMHGLKDEEISHEMLKDLVISKSSCKDLLF